MCCDTTYCVIFGPRRTLPDFGGFVVVCIRKVETKSPPCDDGRASGNLWVGARRSDVAAGVILAPVHGGFGPKLTGPETWPQHPGMRVYGGQVRRIPATDTA
jgi:hypothetical protein